jgi:hypothetical protein
MVRSMDIKKIGKKVFRENQNVPMEEYGED